MLSVPYYFSKNEVIITIGHKERVATSGNVKYLIFSDDHKVYENTDSFLFLKFDSSEVYSKLKVGETYCLRTVGWRINIFSLYPNIIKICS